MNLERKALIFQANSKKLLKFGKQQKQAETNLASPSNFSLEYFKQTEQRYLHMNISDEHILRVIYTFDHICLITT
jgi:hypothetical protein